MEAHTVCKALSWRGLNPIKLEDNPVSQWPAPLTGSALNRLGEYASSPGNRAYIVMPKRAIERKTDVVWRRLMNHRSRVT